ncbi:class I adenylate-forming enzyme family protein [Aspergillus foveolatus]|uniref:class I adenylate-forming enzyme family protein n=1 Tax=Aspergillus foveolatus TaxID=210207 RepID=UPI003CCDFD01
MTQITNEGLPDEPFFEQLLALPRKVNHVVVHDPNAGVDADPVQLLTDLARMRSFLRASLPRCMFDETDIFLQEDKPYVFVLSNGNYEFIIAALSILSIGGAVVPLPTGILPEEALHIARRCESGTVLASQDHLPTAKSIRDYATSHGFPIMVFPIQIKTSPAVELDSPALALNPSLEIPAARPGLLLFTSGSTGPPKGVVHPRRLFYELHTGGSPGEVLLSHRPPHWAGAILPLFRHLLAGTRIEVIVSEPSVLWERLRVGGATLLMGPPRFWIMMMKYYQDHIAFKLPLEEVEGYLRGAQELRCARVSGMMPHTALLRFWRDEIGRPLQVFYNTTELCGGCLSAAPWTESDEKQLDRCIGRPSPSLTVRLSEGDHGELLVKAAAMFTHYLGDEEATRAAFTEDGFYRTGDLVRRVGDDYCIEGRVSSDFVKFRGYKVPILEVEMHLLDLPFIAEGCILSATSEDNGGQVAALVRFQAGGSCLKFLQDGLARSLPAYMLPTMLRVLRDGEEIPRSASLKVLRRKAVEQYFALSDDMKLPLNVECRCVDQDALPRPPRAWDWGGLQSTREV